MFSISLGSLASGDETSTRKTVEGNDRQEYFLINHSPEDKICPIRMAKDAKERLSKEGAAVGFVTYDGGHGWHGNIFGAIRSGIAWLEERP